MIENYIDGTFLKLPKILLKSPYYRWVLSSADKVVWNCLQNSVGYSNNHWFHNKGILAAQIRVSKIVEDYSGNGLCERTIKTSLNHLDELGIAVKFRKKSNAYIIGFRLDDSSDNYFTIYHLDKLHRDKITDYAKNRIPKSSICLSKEIKDFIIKNINNPLMFRMKLNGGKTLMEELFGIEDYFGKSNHEMSEYIKDQKCKFRTLQSANIAP